jgi:hypothetical protein
MPEQCLRGPARERDGVVPRQAGDVDEPDDRLDADGGADADHELAELLVGEVTADAVERLGDPCDRTSLTEGQRVSFGGVGLKREAQHCSLLPHAFKVTGADGARLLFLHTPGCCQAFYWGASEPVANDDSRGIDAGPVDMGRVQASAKKNGGIQILGPPPFSHVAQG